MTATQPSSLAGSTPADVRAQLESLVERQLLGPWDGPDEELPPGVSPAERYLLGRLVPRPLPDTAMILAVSGTDAETDPDIVDGDNARDGDENAEAEPEATVRFGTMAASSLGLAFTVPIGVERINIVAKWGRYGSAPSETQETEQGRARVVWKRQQRGGQVSMDLVDGAVATPDKEYEGVVVRLTVREREIGGMRAKSVFVALINGLPSVTEKPDTQRLYQAGLEVTAIDGASAMFIGHNDPEYFDRKRLTSDPERRHLELLHRRVRKFATGAQCAVDVQKRRDETRAWKLATTSFPESELAPIEQGDATTMRGLVLDMQRLGSPELGDDALDAALRPLASGYRSWLDTQANLIATDSEVGLYGDAAKLALDDARVIAERLDRAIDMLRDNGLAREAFRFANQAMAMQRVHSEVVRKRIEDQDQPFEKVRDECDIPKNRSWRAFQLAFVLLCLPGLTDPSHQDAQRGEDDAQAQLLFFPTGGGKTEAYLGLTAYTLAVRRLQGVVGEGEDARDGSEGVAVLMRYTLRLLTAQQFQRAATLICACERLRLERVAGGDLRWGATPYRIGLWVGNGVTPNSFHDAARQIENAGTSKTIPAMQLAACPWCGEELLPGRDYHTDGARRRIHLYCGDKNGKCPFTRKKSWGFGLPVITVDEEIYRLTPSLVIGTVDKFAQLPRNAQTASLFGLVSTRCERHGWQNPDGDAWCRASHPAAGDLPPVTAQPAMRLRPPDLVIQDELHLISDALGSMVGLFETAIDALASRRDGGKVIRPVLVASTATVRRARDQVSQVFDRGLTVFPPQVIDAGETFFSTRKEPGGDVHGRRYRGICAPGERNKSVAIRVYSAIMEHSQYLFDAVGASADPYMTLVGYFSSTRDLAGTRRLVEDDISERLRRQDARTRRRSPWIKELTSRMPSDRIASTLRELEQTFSADHDSTSALDAYREADEEERAQRRSRPRPADVLLATNMLQVGVDVPRLGLMVVHGQPKNIAEYIQASSRVGRSHGPGLVFSIFNWSRPRDLAHYESFGYDHQTLGLTVEGVTTTPFSERALDKGLTAVMATGIRHSGIGAVSNGAAQSLDLQGDLVDAVFERIIARAEKAAPDKKAADLVREMLQNRRDSWEMARKAIKTGKLGYIETAGYEGLLENPDGEHWGVWTIPMSLREVEPQISLQIGRAKGKTVLEPTWSFDPAGAGTVLDGGVL